MLGVDGKEETSGEDVTEAGMREGINGEDVTEPGRREAMLGMDVTESSRSAIAVVSFIPGIFE